MPPTSGPHIYRPTGSERIRLWMPYDPANRRWLHQQLGERIQPIWSKEHRRWVIARNHFNELVDALLGRFGYVDVEAEFSTTQKCDSNCRRAKHDDCECSCLGEYHGGGIWHGWIQVGDTTLIRPEVQVRHMRITA
ncbi:hypothetical protein ACIBCR_15520 [Micromonospora echinospora]|uniref:hypothetical protein n=1 Tax=Micromonospora echinospora TaxID=1877 RepID=UPI0037AB0F73